MEQIQIIEKRERQFSDVNVVEVLTKGKNYVRHTEWTYNGLCQTYRMLTVLSNNLVELYKYHYCPYAYEDMPEEELEELDEGMWAYVEVEDASRIMSINSIKEFSEVYGKLYQCIRKQNGWEKTVRCTF
jgi:hypothetical protein